MIPKPSKNRSRRLRKKLKIEEFQEFFFTIKVKIEGLDFSIDDYDAKFTNYIYAEVEKLNLSTCIFSCFSLDKTISIKDDCHSIHVGGGYGKNGREPTEDDRQYIINILKEYSPNHSITYISQLKDATYGSYDED